MVTQSLDYFLPSTACRRKRLLNQGGNALDGEIKNILTVHLDELILAIDGKPGC